MTNSEPLQELYEHYHFSVDKGQKALRIDKYISSHLEGTSRNRVQLASAAGYVLVNGKAVKNNYLVRPSDEISVVMPYEKRVCKLIPEDIPLDIPYEDESLLIVNKAAGMTVHPGHGNYEHTLVNALAWHFGQREPLEDEDPRMGVLVHRIDKDTSGLLVIAKTEQAQYFLARQFFDHSVERQYIALVWGDMEADEGSISGNIGRDPSDRLRFAVCKDPKQGKPAVTHYKVLERFGYASLVACRLETGRTHQIRVHMNHIGHPLLNDARYGGACIRENAAFPKFGSFMEHCFEIMPRQALHAQSIGFIHPASRKKVCFTSELPADFKAVLEKMRGCSKVRTAAETASAPVHRPSSGILSSESAEPVSEA